MDNKIVLKYLTILCCVFFLSACDSNETTIKVSGEKVSIEEAKKLIFATQRFFQLSDKEVEMIEITSSDIWD